MSQKTLTLFIIGACFICMQPLFAQQIPRATPLEREMINEADDNTLTEEKLKKYLSNENFNINAQEFYSEGDTATALMNVVWNNNKSMAQLFLKHGADVNAQNDKGNTALARAITYHDKNGDFLPMIKLLLEHGANPNIANKRGLTPFTYTYKTGGAARKSMNDVAKLLLATGKVNLEIDPYSYILYRKTPLIETALNNHPDMFKLLLAHDAHIDARDEFGWTGLMEMAQFKRKSGILLFLEAGANPDLRSYNEKIIAQAIQAKIDYFNWDEQNTIAKYANKTFYDIAGPLLEDPEIQKALAESKLRRQEQKKLLMDEARLPKDLANIVGEYAPTPPSAEFVEKKEHEEKEAAESESEEED